MHNGQPVPYYYEDNNMFDNHEGRYLDEVAEGNFVI